MTRLMWNAAGERIFEAGVDRGVLYIEGEVGVPWNGLISVSESPSGGKVTPYYIDGIKYFNHVSLEEFEAAIEAYTYPEEFAECDGTKLVKNGLFATQQRKKSFGLAYRTKVGNDNDGIDHGYKLHVVYNATAEPTNRSNNTISDSVEPFNFNWSIFTKPSVFTGYKPTAHFVIDSRTTPPTLLGQIENILYGSDVDGLTSRLPSADELLYIFDSHESGFIDAGTLVEPYYNTIDAGIIPEAQTDTFDAGGP